MVRASHRFRSADLRDALTIKLSRFQPRNLPLSPFSRKRKGGSETGPDSIFFSWLDCRNKYDINYMNCTSSIEAESILWANPAKGAKTTIIRQGATAIMYRAYGRGGIVKGSVIGKENSFLLAFLVVMAAGSAMLLIQQSLTAQSVRFAGITVDRLSASLTFLVATVGAAAFRFSQRYLDGESGRQRFLHRLFVTVVMAYVLMLSSHLLLLFAAWTSTSLGLHLLLTHYEDRPEARRPARKKFLISRLGDLALIAAIFLIWRDWGTLDLHEFQERIADYPQNGSASIIGILVVIAALTKSAQFPFHSWLPETMESPTPVSALMHAGIINAGGALLLRFSPLIVRTPEALFLLSAVGTLTFALGMLAMWAQVKVKRTLAWSTVSQMGFMMVQCGLAAFPAALLHILGHGFYKAWSFLRSGELPPSTEKKLAVSPRRTLSLVLLGVGLSLPAMVFASWITGFSPLHSPGELGLSLIAAMSVGQLWVALLSRKSSGLLSQMPSLGFAALISFAAVTAAYCLYRGAGLFLSPVFGELPTPTGLLAWTAALLPVGALILLTAIQTILPILGSSPLGRAFYVHALHGFYFGAFADRVVDVVWRLVFISKKEVARA
jgi:NAD(P)H-quinone oxidoreductase subunit 5